MAVTNYSTSNALAVKLWEKKLFVETLKNTLVFKFIGKTSDSAVQWKDQTNKSSGDQITVGLRMQLSGSGTLGDGTLEGNEEALTTYTDALVINQLRHAVRSQGKMSEQRILFDFRDEATSGLGDWWSNTLDTGFLNQVCGNVAQTDSRLTGLVTPTAPSANNQIWANAITNDQGLGTSDTFTITMLDKAINRAKTNTPMIRPIMVNGKPKYVAILHPNQVYSLRTQVSSSAVTWFEINRSALQGGVYADNPIYNGALGEYNGTIIYEDARIPLGVNSSTSVAVSNTRRGVLLGAQAAIFATGREYNNAEKMTMREELFDYENQLGVSGGMIFGLKKAVFNSADFATVVMSSYAAAP